MNRLSIPLCLTFTILFFTSFGALVFGQPSATVDEVEGTMKVGFPLEVFYTYVPNPNPEGATQFQWYTYDDNFTPGSKTPIAGANSSTFIVTAAQLGLHISVEVIPVDNIGNVGAPEEFFPSWSFPPTPVANPVLPDGRSCNRAGQSGAPDPSNTVSSALSLCSPRSLTWTVSYEGIDFQSNQLPRIVIDWGDGTVEDLLPTLINPEETNQGLQRWQVDAVHTFDYDDPGNVAADAGCSYEMVAYWTIVNGAGVTVRVCRNQDQSQFFTVWDDLDNPDIGNKDINHDPTSTGGEVGETVEVCEGDTNPIRVLDNSTFNCTPPIETLNPNEQTRWYQWVYGSTHNITTGAAADEKIYVNGIAYDAPDFPLYGPPQLLVGPVDTPNGITDDIQMPTTSQDGEVFEVTLRSWNSCNQFSVSGDNVLGPQGAPFNVFDIYSPGGTVQDGSPSPLYSNNNPVQTTFDIVIVAKPIDPTANDNTICEGAAVPNFSINFAAASSSVTWYENNAGAPGNLIANSLGTNSKILPPNDYEPGGAINTNTPGVYTVWASYVANTGSQDCESDPIPVSLTIREDLPQPTITYGGSDPICADVGSITVSASIPPATEPIGGDTEYIWSLSGSGVSFNGGNTGNTVTIDINPATSGPKTIELVRRYDTAPQCSSPADQLVINVDALTEGGDLTTPLDPICEGDVSQTISLNNHVGSVLRWERNGSDIGHGGATSITDTPPSTGSYTYVAVLKNGVCGAVNSDPTTLLVNPIPTTPTISEVGDGQNICEDGSQIILESSNADGNADEYAWFEDPNLTTPIQQTASNQLTLSNVSESGRYYVQVIGIDPTNCESPLSAPIDVTISELPTADVTGGGSVCAGIPGPPAVITMTGIGPFNVTYERNGNPTTVNGITSPYTIPGSTTVTDDPDTYLVTSITDLGTTVNCTVSAPSVNITGSATIQTSGTPPPDIDSYVIGAPICDDGAGTPIPPITLDLNPNSAETYDITFEVRDGASTLLFSRTLTNKTTDAAGVYVFTAIDLDYDDLSNIPDNYQVRLTSIINTVTGCNAASLPANQPLTINPRPADPANPVDAIACSSDASGATLSVADPGAGNTIIWFEDAGLTTPATGTTSGAGDREFTPTSNATVTYYAVTQSNTAPTNCFSANAISVEHTQDVLPNAAAAGADDQTCGTSYTLSGNTATNGGMGTWVYPGLLYFEDFQNLSDGVTSDSDLFGWTRDISAVTFDGTDHFEIRSNSFQANDTDGEAVWISGNIDISAITDFNISVDVLETGDHEPADYIELTYQIDGNPEQTVGTETGDFSSATISGAFPTGGGSNLTIRIKVLNNANGETINFDNITLTDVAGVAYTFDDIHDENATVSGLPEGNTILTWTVASALGACPASSDMVTITRHPLPDAIDPTPEVCEDVPQGSGTATIPDLAAYNDEVTGIVGSTDRTIDYYSDVARTLLISPTTDYVITTTTNVVYTRVTSTDVTPNCTNDGTLTFTINSLPDAVDQNVANNATETEFCEDAVGVGEYDDLDLTALNDDVIGAASLANRTIDWFGDPDPIIPVVPSDLTGFAITTPNDVDNVFDGDLFYAVITDNTTLCQSIATVSITINPRPIDNALVAPDGSTPATLTICSSGNVLFFQIDGAQTPGSTYNWTLPTAVGELEYVSGGGTNDFFVLLRAPNPIVSPGVTLSVQEVSSEGCPGNVNAMNIIVDDDPGKPVITGSSDVCSNQQNVIYSIAAPVGGSTYTWNIGSLGSIVSGQGTSAITVNIGTNSASITVTETNATGCSSPVADPYPVTVNDRPAMTSPNTAEICSGDQVDGTLTFISDIPGSTFTWEVISRAGAVSGASVGNTGTGDINQVLTNVSGVTGAITYEVRPIGPASQNSCPGTAQIVTVTVNSEPVGIADNRPICSDLAINYDIQSDNIDASGNGLASEFTYIVSSSDGANVPPAADRVTPSQASITDSYTNTTGVDVFLTYEITPIELLSGDGCVGSTFDVVFRIRSESVGSDDAITECSGTALNYDLQTNVNTAPGNGVASNFTWIATNNGNVTGESLAPQSGPFITDQLINTTGSDEIVNYTVTPTNSANSCDGNTFTVSVTVQSEPEGNNEAIDVCSDTGLAYDLQANVSTGNNMPSTFEWLAADNPAITGESLTVQSTGTISDILVNTTGVDEEVVYTVTPTASSNLCEGEPFTVTVTVFSQPQGADELIATCSNDQLGYDLQTNINTLGNGLTSSFSWVANDNVNVTGESLVAESTGTIDDLLINNTGIDQFVTYTVIPTDITNLCTGAPFTITVEVYSEPEGVDDTAVTCSGDALTYDLQVDNIDLSGNGLPSTFEWVAAPNANISGESTAPQTGSVINDVIFNTTPSDQTVIYTVNPIDNNNNCEGQSFTVTVTVQSDPLGADDADVICSSSAVNYNLQANINTLGNGLTSTFSWQAIVDNPDVSGESLAPQSGSSITDLLVNVTGADEIVRYRVIPIESTNGCQGAPFEIEITVKSEPVGNNDAITSCSDVALSYNLQANINSLGGNGMPSTFEWAAVADNPNVIGESIALQVGSFIDDNLTNLTSVTQLVTYTVTPQATASPFCSGTPFTVEVTVNPEPVGSDDTKTTCSREEVDYDLQDNINSLGNTRPSNFVWVAASNLDVNGESTTNRTTGTINDILINTSGVDQNVIYTVTPTGVNGCLGDSFEITVTVQSEPVGVADNSYSQCSDEALNYNLQTNLSNGLNSDFTWVASPNASVSNESTTPQTGDIIDDVITNVTGFNQIVSYTVTPTGVNGCPGDDFQINITINSEPRGLDANVDICSQDGVGYDLQGQNINTLGNNMPSNFTWVAVSTGAVTGASTTDQTGSTITDVLTNVSGSDQTVEYEVTPVSQSDNCEGDVFRVFVNVRSEPVGINTTEAAQCSSVTFTFDPQANIDTAPGNSVSSNFTWTAVYDPGLNGGTNNGSGVINETLINRTVGQLSAVYTVTPSAQSGNCIGSSFIITVPVDPEPVGSNEVKAPICSGDAFDYNPQDNVDANNGLASTFTWTATYPAGLTGPGAIPPLGTGTGNVAETLENKTGGRLNAVYTVIPTSGCVGESFTITVRVDPEPVGNDLTLAPECSDVLFNYNPQTNINDNNSLTSTFTWTATYDTDLVGGAGTGTNVISESLTNQTGGVLNAEYTITPFDAGTGCEGEPFVVTQPINPEPLGIDITVAAVCSDDNFGINPQDNIDAVGGNGLASSFTWTASYPAGLTNGAGSGAGPINETLINETGTQLSATYTVTPRDNSNNCFGDPFLVIVPVDPEPDGFNEVKGAVCSNVGFDFDPQSNVVNGLASTFTWTATYPAGLTGPGGALPLGTGTGNVAETLENTTSARISAVYTVTPISGVCVGNDFVITVPIDPEPLGTSTVEPAICSREQISLDLQSYISNSITSTFSWSANYNGLTGGAGSGIGNISETLINDTGAQVIVQYTVTARGLAASCFGAPFTIDVPVDPSPVAIDQNIAVCSDIVGTEIATLDLTLQDNAIMGGAGNTVTWYQDQFLNLAIGDPTNHTVFDGIPIYALVDDGTCQNVAVVIYDVEPLPEVTGVVTSDYNGWDVSCMGALDGEITATATATPGPYTYELLDDAQTPLGPSNATGVFTGLGAGVYLVRAIDNSTPNLCSSVSFPIIITDPTPLSGGFVFGPQNICDGDIPDPFTEIAQPFGGIGNYTYQWEISTDNVSYTDIGGATSPIYAHGSLTNATTSPITYYFKRRVESGTCAVVYSNSNDPIEITVNPTPDGTFDFYSLGDLNDPSATPITEICEGEPFGIRFDFPVGTAPFRFDYDDGSTFNTDVFGVDPTPIIYPTGIDADLTISMTRVSDVFSCENTLAITRTLSVISIDPSFTATPPSVCSGDAVVFDFSVDPDVEYTFNFGDGDTQVIAANSLPNGPNSVSHIYQNGNFVSDVTYPVTLSASKTVGTVCNATPVSSSVTIYANVFANIIPERTAICAGESILFDNQSLGVINRKWFYREKGVTEERDVRTSAGDQTFVFDNPSATDPIVYEVVFQGDNGNCSDEQIIEIEVYKGLDASFDITDITEYVLGKGEVTLTNTSTPTPPDDSFFTYEWSFGLDATPQTFNGYNQPTVIEYSEPGTKQISLTVTNIAAAADGVGCSDTHSETFDIILPPISADFTLDPTEGCSRLTVNATNTSVGANKFTWSVIGANDDTVQTSSEIQPSFVLISPGEYRVILKSEYPSTGQVEISAPQFVTVYENPVARFEVPQQVVYIPDDAFRPVNRSQGAEIFNWDFGDGNIVEGVASPSHIYDLPNEDPGYLVIMQAINEDGCIDIDSARIRVEEGGFTKTPNAFTPSPNGPSSGLGGGSGAGGSALNDIFLPITEGVLEFRMMIFDRWGNLIFESDDKTIGWDGYNNKGQLLPAGVYVYKLDLLLSNGQRTTRVGDVTLIR